MNEIEDLKIKRDKLIELYLDGIIDKDKYIYEVFKYNRLIDELYKEIKDKYVS